MHLRKTAEIPGSAGRARMAFAPICDPGPRSDPRLATLRRNVDEPLEGMQEGIL